MNSDQTEPTREYSQMELELIDTKIDNFDDKKIAKDINQTLSEEYKMISTRNQSVIDKYNFLLSAFSILLSLSLVLLPVIYQPTSIFKDSFSAYFGFWYTVGLSTLLLSFVILLYTYYQSPELRLFGEKELVDLAEYYNDYEIYLRERMKSLVRIINHNYVTIEQRKKLIRRFIYPLVLATILMFVSAPIIILRADDPSSVHTIEKAIYSLNKGAQHE